MSVMAFRVKDQFLCGLHGKFNKIYAVFLARLLCASMPLSEDFMFRVKNLYFGVSKQACVCVGRGISSFGGRSQYIYVA